MCEGQGILSSEDHNRKVAKNSSRKKEKEKWEDGLFADMVYEMLCDIPDRREKAMAKLEFQQKLIQLEYRTPAAVPTASTFNPFPMSPYYCFFKYVFTNRKCDFS